jgi:CspA family cold shock protein
MHRGVVKWFNDLKGFGLIEGPDRRDIFVHYTAIDSPGYRSLIAGEQVEFEITEGGLQGLRAVHVRKL